ncbi:EF-hand domain-containing protein [Streptomyces axinellae]|uniref:EF-hand domain-containing protein n=1 Tax=Streptomyces axinellae TaxID=552788 RepID=A0ABP6CBW3_9ACTN
MRTEALDRVRLVFTLFDADGNGVIEADDFELMAGRVVAAVPETDAAKRSTMQTAFRTFWTALADNLDANGDGKVSFEEFQAVVLDPEQFTAAIGEFAEALTAVADPDGDGLVERPAFVAVMTAIGFALPNIHALFDALEPVGTEQASVPVWAEAIKEYYSPDAAGTAGDLLVAAPVV